jgi:hypothetical protein
MGVWISVLGSGITVPKRARLAWRADM